MTPEQKKANKKFVLNNWNKYILDSRGNFYSLDLEMEGNERYFIGKEAVDDYESLEELIAKNIINDRSKWGVKYPDWIIEEIAEVILQEKDQWKIVHPCDLDVLISFKRSSGEELKSTYFTWNYDYILTGELGYRKDIWKDYDKKKTKYEKKIRRCKEVKKQNRQQNQPTSPNIPSREQEELINQKQQLNQEITSLLNQEQFSNNELSTNYQNWEEQINNINDPHQLNTFKEQLLTDINTKKKQKQTTQEVNNNLTTIQTGTSEEQTQAWENLEQNIGEQAYEEHKEVITELKVEQATKDTYEYQERIVQKLTKCLTEQELSESDLSSETKAQYEQLKNGELTDPV